MALRVVVLGAGFGGLELTALLRDAAGSDIDLVLIDKSDAFTFGFAKLDVMFGRATADDVRHRYADIVKPGVRFVHSVIRSIDPAAKRVVTDAGTFDGDVLVVALGADVVPSATPGLVEGGNEFYTLKGAIAAGEALRAFAGGKIVVGVSGRPFKCPPAPSETTLLLDAYLKNRGLREASQISLVMPLPVPVPPSPDTSQALLKIFAERGITFVKENSVTSLDPERKIVKLGGGSELPYDLFFGVPVHRVPPVVIQAGLSSGPDDWVPVNKSSLETRFPGVFAIGDVNGIGTPKAGVFAEGAARVVAAKILAKLGKGAEPESYAGQGSCYVEFGDEMVGRVDVDFLSGPTPTSSFQQPSKAMAAEKAKFGASRRTKWFRA